jgi:hypothetical protein
LTLHRNLAMNMMRGFEGTDKLPRALLELPESRFAVASYSDVMVFNLATSEIHATAATPGVIALALANDSRGHATPLVLAEDASSNSTSLHALTVDDHRVAMGAKLCQMPGFGYQVRTVGATSTALLSWIPDNYANLLSPAGMGTFSQTQLRVPVTTGFACPASDRVITTSSWQLFQTRGISEGAVSTARMGDVAAAAPMCAISSRLIAATATAGTGEMRAVYIIDTETGRLDSTVCTIDVRSAVVQPTREQQQQQQQQHRALRRGGHGGGYGFSGCAAFTASAQLHASPDGRTLHTLEHPAEGGSALKAWDTSVRDARVPIAVRRSAAVVTAMLVLQDGRIAYATVDGDVNVVAAL